jgi:hypothetical protein
MDCGHTDLVIKRELRNALAIGVTLGDLAALTSVEHRLTPQLLPQGLRACDASLTARPDKLALEFGDASHDGEDKLAVGRRGVEPLII